MAIVLGAALCGGCVELPGVYNNVLLHDRPSASDCLSLQDALTSELSLRLQPSPYECAVTLDNGDDTPARNVVIFAYFRQQRVLVEIDELRSGRPITPSPGTRRFAERVMQVVHEHFPAARVVPVREFVGPIPR